MMKKRLLESKRGDGSQCFHSILASCSSRVPHWLSSQSSCWRRAAHFPTNHENHPSSINPSSIIHHPSSIIHQSINPSIHQSINPSIHQSIIHSLPLDKACLLALGFSLSLPSGHFPSLSGELEPVKKVLNEP